MRDAWRIRYWHSSWHIKHTEPKQALAGRDLRDCSVVHSVPRQEQLYLWHPRQVFIYLAPKTFWLQNTTVSSDSSSSFSTGKFFLMSNLDLPCCYLNSSCPSCFCPILEYQRSPQTPPSKTNPNLFSLSSLLIFFKGFVIFITPSCMVSNRVKLLHQDAPKQPHCSSRDFYSGKGDRKITSAVSPYIYTLTYKTQ